MGAAFCCMYQMLFYFILWRPILEESKLLLIEWELGLNKTMGIKSAYISMQAGICAI